MRNFWPELTSDEIEVAASQKAIILIPLGSTEQHGSHLPVGTDAMIGLAISQHVCERVNEKIRALYLPSIWLGFSPQHVGFPGTISLEPETFIPLVFDLCSGLWSQGFRRIFLLNAHGKNRAVLSVTTAKLMYHQQVTVVLSNYWNFVLDFIKDWRVSELGGINHAGEMETALMLHLYPDLVDIKRAQKEIYTPKSTLEGQDIMKSGIINIERRISDISKTGTIGDPTVSTKSKGSNLFVSIVNNISNFLIEFDDWPR
jgi:creatinine amidohydrolase